MISYRFRLLMGSIRYRSESARWAAAFAYAILWTSLWLTLVPHQVLAADLKRIAPLLSRSEEHTSELQSR